MVLKYCPSDLDFQQYGNVAGPLNNRYETMDWTGLSLCLPPSCFWEDDVAILLWQGTIVYPLLADAGGCELIWQLTVLLLATFSRIANADNHTERCVGRAGGQLSIRTKLPSPPRVSGSRVLEGRCEFNPSNKLDQRVVEIVQFEPTYSSGDQFRSA